jgi:starch-binding outer membrane protein, SusD/RagB family
MKKIVISIMMGLLAFTSCNDEDFLQKFPHSPTDLSFYTTVDGAKQGLMAAYDVLQLGERVERIEFFGTVCSGDAMAGGQPGGGDQPAMQAYMKFQAAASGVPATYIGAYWAAMYMGIYRCNILIQYMEDVESLVDFPEETRQQLIGEATFLRGLFHFKLQTKYGGYPQLQEDFNNQLLGVPYLDHVLAASEWAQVRPTLDETWTNIEEDFQAAADLLKNRDDYSVDYRGRATKGAAQAMLAKSHLYQNEFEPAYEIIDGIIASDQYKLMGENGELFTVDRLTKEGIVPVQMPGYKWIWQPEANNCDESIFDVQHMADHTTLWPEGEEGSLVATYYRPRNVMAYGAEGTLGTVNIGWGFILPTTFFLETAYAEVGCEPRERDPRFDISVIEPTDSIPFYYVDPILRATYPDSVAYDAWFNWPCTGYATWKYFEDPIFNINNTQLGDNPMNTKYFRFADLLLMGAEAALQTGHADKATEWINRVRTRARNSGNTGFPEDLTQSEVTLEAVYAERRVELAFEGHQFFDIVRTGRAVQVLTVDALSRPEFITTTNPIDNRTAPQQFGDQFQTGKNEIFPIPQTEVDLSGGVLTQNPGY